MSIDLKEIGEQFSNLDPENIGNWPIVVRSLIVISLCAAVLGAGYYFDTQHQQIELDRVVAEEEGLWDTILEKGLKEYMPELKVDLILKKLKLLNLLDIKLV